MFNPFRLVTESWRLGCAVKGNVIGCLHAFGTIVREPHAKFTVIRIHFDLHDDRTAVHLLYGGRTAALIKSEMIFWPWPHIWTKRKIITRGTSHPVPDSRAYHVAAMLEAVSARERLTYFAHIKLGPDEA